MTRHAPSAAGQSPHRPRLPGPAFPAGLLLLAWLAAQVAIIGHVSWMQLTTAGAALVVLVLAGLQPGSSESVARKWLGYYVGVARHPAATFDALSKDPRRVWLGTLALLSNAALYTLVYAFLVVGHGRPTVFRPWLAIDPEHYYRWDVFLTAPSMVMAWLLAAAVAHLMASRLGGRGSFEDALAALGFGIAVASWCTLLHDLVTSFLGAAGIIDQRAYEDAMSTATPIGALIWLLMLAYLAAFVALFTTAIAAVYRVGRGRALLAGLASFACYQLVFVVFNR